MTANPTPRISREPHSVVMEVGPETAIKWLEGNTRNRPVNQAHVDRLAREIKANRWRLTHQGIAFDTEGLLIDGQHRLWAIVEANRTVPIRVFFNEPPENKQVVDSGERRSNLDIMRIGGDIGKVTVRHLATLRAMLAGRSSHPVRMSAGEETGHFQRHREAVEFAVKHLNGSVTKGIATAMTRAVVARAYYSANRAKLAHFCDVMKSGMSSDDGDSPIGMLWQYLVRTSSAGKTESAQRLRYAKTEWALSAFLRGQQPKRLCHSDCELFPLPEEMPQEAAA